MRYDSKEAYYERAQWLLDITPAMPASLYLRPTRMETREQAYAMAFAIMARADETWPR